MALRIRTIELIPRNLEAVRFRGDAQEREAIRQWVQDRTPEGTVVLSKDSFYIHAVSGVEKVEEGQWILFDTVDRFFRSATNGAIRAFYRDVRDPLDD